MAAPGRPLRGLSFFLDVPSGRAARDLAVAIRHLGGVTEGFLSKEVSYVVSSNKEAKRDRARAQAEKRNSTASEDAKAQSPVPPSSKGNHARPQQKPPDTALISRGKELLQKAMRNQDTCSGSSILANARLWGVQILHVDEMLSYAQQLLRAALGARKQSQRAEVKCLVSGSKIRKAGKLKPPFLKVEDESRQFRPFHHQFKSFPDLNFLAPKSSSPFEPLKSLPDSCRARAVEGCLVLSDGERSPQSTPITVPKRRRGFCECCQETFEELQKHLQSPQHRRFALDDSQYAAVDRVIAQLTSSFVEQWARVPRSPLADEHCVPQAGITRGAEMLTAELGKERQQPEQGGLGPLSDAEPHPGLRTKEHTGDRVSDPREAGGSSGNCSSVGAALTRGVCAARGAVEEFVVSNTGSGSAPAPGRGICGAASHVRGATASPEPAPRKRPLPPAWSSQLGKRPRLELGAEQDSLQGAGVGECGAGQTPEQAPSPGTELSSRPRTSPALALCLPGDAVSQPGSLGALSEFDPMEDAAESTVSNKCAWSRVSVSDHGQPGGEGGNAPRGVSSPTLGCALSMSSSCPAGQCPSVKPESGHCCSLCIKAAENITPELSDHSREQSLCPGPLQPLPRSPRADCDLRQSSSASDWDVQLLPVLMAAGHSGPRSVDRELLQRTQVNVGDSGYASRLCSVLKQSSEWAGGGDRNCRSCCTGTQGASVPVFQTFFGS